MNRSQIVDAVAAKAGIEKATAKAAIDEAVDQITRALAAGDRVHIADLGTFHPEVVPSRMVRNPATGKKVRSKKTARVKFRPALALKDTITGRKRAPK